MGKYISKTLIWNNSLINFIGSPRPSLNVPQSFWNRKKILANRKMDTNFMTQEDLLYIPQRAFVPKLVKIDYPIPVKKPPVKADE